LIKFLKKGEKIKRLNNLILLLTSIFILYILASTIYNIKTLNKLYETKKEILFYKLYFLSQNFLEEILKEYAKSADIIKEKEKFVINNLDKNLTYLKNKIGKNYHIFITDKNFIIRKTTFKYDQNFSLAFAKDIFYKHKNKIGISPPICEPATTNFFIYTDTLLNNRVIQVGYIINSSKITKIKKELKKLKKKNPFIKDITLFFIHPETKYAQECKILSPLKRKYTLKEMIQTRKFGINIYYKLLKHNPLITKNSMYILGKNPFDKRGYVIFELKLNNAFLKEKIQKIILISALISLVLIIIALIIYTKIHNILNYIKNFTDHIKKEKTFNQITNNELKETIDAYNNTLQKLKLSIKAKEDFTHFAMHELATPINILALYADDYKELKPAIKKLLTAYKNLSYVTKGETKSKIDLINIKDIIIERIEFFKEIIEIENIKIHLNLKNDLYIKANKEEIETLIDNNIKNAINYATTKEIFITLDKNKLCFENYGKIKNLNKIFEKFYREDNVKGGFGLGLSIIKNIADKYNIEIKISQNKKVKFEYIFKEENENSNN